MFVNHAVDFGTLDFQAKTERLDSGLKRLVPHIHVLSREGGVGA